ncbi:MAG: VCBS repeat-containing protein [Candidatus Eisenbacteria bacterium]|nr:VCBS repeat-containing protein [Candidatus Eisenbacteria bacterium]
MKKLLCTASVGAGLLASVLVGVAPAATTLEREFRYGPERFALVRLADGTTAVEMPGAIHEFTAGRPDLPQQGEVLELPAGMRVTAVEVVTLETAPLAAGVRMASAIVTRPGVEPVERSAPDPAWYQRSGFEPGVPVRLGVQGFARGREVATLNVTPLRWDPASGVLERVSRLRVRLTLEAAAERPLERQRIVPEWERGDAAGPRQARSASLAGRPRVAQPFRPTQVPSLLGSPVAYVIITNEAMASTLQQLADWKTQSGVPAVVRTMSFIQQEYPFGADDAERVRLFIRDAYTRWGTKWVLLGGDTDVIPTRNAYTTFYGGENIACDMYYSCLDGNWNADGDSLYGEGYYSALNPGDSVDLLPEVYVGRAPIITAADAQLFVNKCFQYEKTPVGDYEDHILFFAEVLFPQDWTPGTGTSLDGAQLIEEDILPIMDGVPCVKYARLYENYTDARWRPGALQERRTVVIDSLNRGYNIAVHVGHGYRNVMSVGDDNLTNADAMGLTNGSRLINLYAIDCTSNAIDFPSIGEAYLKAPNGGAVTNIGSTRFDFPTAGRSYQQEYFRLLFSDSITAIGEAQARQKLPFVGFSTYDGVNRWTQMTLLLLGDPELRVYTCTPRTLTVARPASVPVSDSSFSVHVAIGGTPLYGARVTAYKPGDEFESVLTNGAGDALVPFRPDSLGNLTLTVTAFNARPYQATVPVVASGQEVLADLPVTVDDDNLGGTAGNADGLFDAGETVDLDVPVRNNGGASAPAVTGTLSTTDPVVTVLVPAQSYGTIAAGAVANPPAGFRVSVPFSTADQREIPFTLRLLDGNGRTTVQKLQVVLRAPELGHIGHGVLDVGGNSDGKPDPGETVSYYVKLRNLGTGIAQTVSARLRSLDGLATVSDSTASWGDIASGQELQGDALTFVPSSASAKLQLVVSDQYGQLWSKTLDLTVPATPADLFGVGAATSIKLTWAKSQASDLLGYNLYRSTAAGGPFTKINPVPTDRIAYYQDEGLAALTRYYYKVSAVDSSGNESTPSAAQSASTNPPRHTIFPIPMGRNTPASVAVDHVYTGYPMDLVAGADYLYLWHPDGNAPVDADGAGTTSGDFTNQGSYYAAGASIADVDGGSKEIIAPTWDSMQLFVFDLTGSPKPGWPVWLYDPVWSGVAVGDLLGNGQKGMVFGSNGNNIYAFRANGTEWMDGDANPATTGVFKVVGSAYNFGTPALAPLEGGSQLDIIYGSYDGNLYAWRPNGTSVPGFPVYLGGAITSSVAVGYLDGAGDTQLDIVVTTAADALTAIRADGTVRTGFPLWEKFGGTSRSPSPALADMNGDGYLDIVTTSTNGATYVWNRNGQLQPPWNGKRYSTLTNYASESSPVVADINGDSFADVVMGDENGQLAALSGADGSMMPGFPIQLDGEVRGTPALCDCDGDGMTEIVVVGWDKNLYMWDYDFSFSPGGIPPWPQFHHDALRTGFASNLPFTGVEDGGRSAPARVELAAPWPNPARGSSRLSYGVPADRAGQRLELAIYDLGGRRVRSLERGAAQAGRFSAAWDLRADDGSRAGAGVYFARLTLGGSSESRKLVVIP